MKSTYASKALTLVLLFFATGCSKSIQQDRIYIPKKGPHRERPKEPVAPAIPIRDTSLLIAIDAGHGGKDEGAQTLEEPKAFEKNMTLSTAHFLNNYLKGFGYHTVMVRTGDLYIHRKERSKFANEKGSDLFVSVHYNGAKNTKAQGIEVYYYNSESNAGRTAKSKRLAETVLDNVITNTQAKSRGVKHGNFCVIKETAMPAILVEGGFMTNADEAKKIRDATYMKKIAWGIANGIRQYLRQQGS